MGGGGALLEGTLTSYSKGVVVSLSRRARHQPQRRVQSEAGVVAAPPGLARRGGGGASCARAAAPHKLCHGGLRLRALRPRQRLHPQEAGSVRETCWEAATDSHETRGCSEGNIGTGTLPARPPAQAGEFEGQVPAGDAVCRFTPRAQGTRTLPAVFRGCEPALARAVSHWPHLLQ